MKRYSTKWSVLVAAAIFSLAVVNSMAWSLYSWPSSSSVFWGFAGVNGNGDAGTIGQYSSSNPADTLYDSLGKRISDGGWDWPSSGTAVNATYWLEFHVWDHTVYNDVLSMVSNTYGDAGGRATQ